MDIVFDVEAKVGGVLADPSATLIAENLRCFAAGPSHRFHKDVELLDKQAGIHPEWVEGALALADVMEDTLVGRREGPIPLAATGKGTNALIRALSLTGPASWDANSDYARLLKTLRDAQAS